MELVNDFTVNAPIDEAWATLTDLERIAPCMPGAQLTEIEGETYRGLVKVKVGPITAQFKGQAQFATWLTRIAINEALARVRRRGRYEPFEDSQGESSTVPIRSSPDPEQLAFAGELRDLLEWAIDSLPDGAREVFMLRDVEGLSISETAACLGIPEQTAKMRIQRARVLLRNHLSVRAQTAMPATYQFAAARRDALVTAVLARIVRLDPHVEKGAEV